MRKTICILLVCLLCLIPFGSLASENLLTNGDFSTVSGSLPDGWSREMWYTETGVSDLHVDENGYDGYSVAVVNMSENDARFAQTVSVEPDTLYRISCMCRASGCDTDGYGASISIKDTFSYSELLYDTGDEWRELVLYGQTGPEQTELTVFARIGGYGYLGTGRAWFDNFEMTEVDAAPEGVAVANFDPSSLSSGDSSDSDDSGFSAAGEPARNTEMYLLLTAIYTLAIFAVIRKFRRQPEGPARRYAVLFALTMLAAFAVRAVLAVLIPGYNTDINCFAAWSERMFSRGLFNFYEEGYFCDYPPLYMLMLWPIAAIRNLFGLSYRSGAHLLLLKLWPIACDLIGAALVWRRAQKRLGPRGALLLSAFIAFNPAVIADSAAWGQIDSVLTLLVVLCALYAAEERYIPSLACFALAALIKPQALLFAPLGLFAILVYLLRRSNYGKAFHRSILSFCGGVGTAVGLMYLVGLCCSFDLSRGVPYAIFVQPFEWLVSLYRDTMTGYSHLTVNALNLYQIFDLNWADTSAEPAWTIVAWVLFALSYLYCFFLCLRTKNRRHLPMIGGLLILLIFTFGPMIHERYLYPAILLLALGYIHARDRRLLVSMTAVTATMFLNIVLVLQGGMTEANYGHLQSSEQWLNALISVINVVNALFLSWTAFDVCVRDHVSPLSDAAPETLSPAARSLAEPDHHRLKLKRIDVLLMAAVTLAYSVVAFVNLGSTEAPQTSWTSSAAGETIVFDLGEMENFRMTYYGGICNSTFTVELSNDGENWTEPVYALYNQGEIFRWIWFVPQTADGSNLTGTTVPTDDGGAWIAYAGYQGEAFPRQTARYVRITAQAAGLVLSEVAFLDGEDVPLPVQISAQSGAFTGYESDAGLLIDEQETVPAYPSYYNSTYFDEIYHARTAYEHLHGMSTYEWTHPPLGKVTMMIGVALFGMTPFGWRFMGALMGVLMVPLMYLLAKQLTKSTKLSFAAMFLMAVDSMHFTQTCIATIDSYAVFWIMLMYLFMFRYCQMSWNRQPLRRTLIPLGLCGVTMGIAWATKWIGFYASAGLAILFFWTLFRRWREYRMARNQKDAASRKITDAFAKNTAITIAFCLLFFVAIPLLIYYFSHFWYLRYYGVDSLGDMFSGDSVRRVLELQQNMFNYHAGLGGDTHYFRSEWYEWPIIWWPMWYYSGTTYMPSGVISSISCMGNPAVWWFGLVALLLVLVRMCAMRRAPKSYILVIIGFASQFLPWVIVPRSTFIYHYFASVPFIILASVLMLDWIRTRSKRAFNATTIGLLVAALVLFIAFYPLESGTPVARSYANYLRWFKWYNF